MEEEFGEGAFCKENLVACITLYGAVMGPCKHPSDNNLLVNLEVDESRKALISDYERKSEVVEMLEEIVEWLRDTVWVSVIFLNAAHTLRHIQLG